MPLIAAYTRPQAAYTFTPQILHFPVSRNPKKNFYSRAPGRIQPTIGPIAPNGSSGAVQSLNMVPPGACAHAYPKREITW